jgi:hypothetical protein
MAFPKRREMVRSEHAELIALMETARVAPTLFDIDAIDRRMPNSSQPSICCSNVLARSSKRGGAS